MPLTIETFTQQLNLSTTQLERLLSNSLASCLESPELKQQLNSLDINLLRQSLPTAGKALAERLPLFYNWLENQLGVQRVPDSPDHTTKWVIGFLNNQENLMRLVQLHRPVPRLALENSIPRLIATFDGVEDRRVRQEWQKTIALLCIPLVVAARENERLLVAA